MGRTLVVKNTFICAVDAEALSPPVGDLRRAKTADAGALPTAEEFRAAGPCFSGIAVEQGPKDAAALAEVRGAFQAEGSRAVLRALEVASPEQTRSFAARLRGLACEAARSAHAHIVLEELVHRLGTEDSAFLAEELQEHGRSMALNAFGSSVLCRLLEYSASDPRMVALVDGILSGDAASLCCHKFGHEVAMSIFSNGPQRHRSQVLSTLGGEIQRFARHRYASHLLEHALLHGSSDEGHALAIELMGQPGSAARGAAEGPGRVASLARHVFGVQVVRALLQLPSAGPQAMQYLRKGGRRVLKDKYGSALMRELGVGEDSLTSAAGSIGGA